MSHPFEALAAEQAGRDYWGAMDSIFGHLSPKPRKWYSGYILYSIGYTDYNVLDYDFKGLDGNPWTAAALSEFLDQQFSDREEKRELERMLTDNDLPNLYKHFPTASEELQKQTGKISNRIYLWQGKYRVTVKSGWEFKGLWTQITFRELIALLKTKEALV